MSESFNDKVVKEMEERKQLFLAKNSNYGDSWRKGGEMIAKLFPNGITLKNEKDMIFYGVMVRKLDKFNRTMNLRFGGQADKVGEKIAETLADDAVYSQMLSVFAQEEE